MSWIITSYKSVGPIQLGSTRNSIREQLGNGFESFAKDDGENLTDAYDAIGVHLYYDGDDKLEMVEIFEPASVTFKGILLLGRRYEEVEHDLSEIGCEGELTDVGSRYSEAGIALTLNESVIEGVAVFRKGYYEDC